MILMDFSQVILATLFVSIGNHTNIELSEDLIRHMFLTSLRHNKRKFSAEYGELVVCCDGKNSWRRESFPYYKANRRAGRETSEIDWAELFRILNTIRDELVENFPYKVIHIDSCEADDIIGTLCHRFGTQLNNGTEKILILSGDKDYVQLQQYSNVEQYDPVGKKYVRKGDALVFLTEQILRGDTGDGIPNILSPDNCLVVGERQKPMTAKRLELYSKGEDVMDELTKQRFYRNRLLINLSYTPQEHKDEIMRKFEEENKNGRSKLFNYFIEKKLKNLMTDIQDF